MSNYFEGVITDVKVWDDKTTFTVKEPNGKYGKYDAYHAIEYPNDSVPAFGVDDAVRVTYKFLPIPHGWDSGKENPKTKKNYINAKLVFWKPEISAQGGGAPSHDEGSTPF